MYIYTYTHTRIFMYCIICKFQHPKHQSNQTQQTTHFNTLHTCYILTRTTEMHNSEIIYSFWHPTYVLTGSRLRHPTHLLHPYPKYWNASWWYNTHILTPSQKKISSTFGYPTHLLHPCTNCWNVSYWDHTHIPTLYTKNDRQHIPTPYTPAVSLHELLKCIIERSYTHSDTLHKKW